MPAKVLLQVTSGPIQGTVFSFESHDTFLFGRHDSCHARLPKDPMVSRNQFILEVNPPDVRLRDLASLNGTYVNGVKYGGRAAHENPQDAAGRQFPDVDLSDGDRISVGNTTIQVSIAVPLTCGQCGAEIAADDRPSAEWMPGSFLCHTCRGKLSTGDYAGSVYPLLTTARKPAEVGPACERCGKNVAHEVGQRRGQYVCQSCRAEVLSGGDVRQLLQQAVERQNDQPTGIAGYDLGKVLGKGGMGIVHQAVRKSDGAVVAVKVMLPSVAVDESARRMFLREIDVTRRLRHENLVALLDSGSAGSAFYFALEFCNGRSLDRLMAHQGGKLPLAIAGPIMLQCLAGLEFAHAQGFVHRDLKPPNILLHREGATWTSKVSDFGLAKNFESAGLSGMTATGTAGGTFDFMPREQLTDFKFVRPVSDIWSIGATFYNVLTGQFPRNRGAGSDPVDVILNAKPVPIRQRNSAIPQGVAAVIDRALAVNEGERFPSAGEMKAALAQALG